MNGSTLPTVRLVLDLNDLELSQLRRVIENAPAALNAGFIAKALGALEGRGSGDASRAGGSMLLRRQAE
jgi:hypothetical protein